MTIDTNGGAYISGKVSTQGGEFIGRDKIEIVGGRVNIQYYGPLEAGKWTALMQRKRRPYLGPNPYTFEDQWLFSGRETEISQTLQRLAVQQTIVVYGAPDVGKTSLLTAGIIPVLRKNYGGLPLYLPDYADPINQLKKGLFGLADDLGIDAPAGATIVALVTALTGKSQQGLVLVLDQFERFLEQAERSQTANDLLQTLAELLNNVEPRWLRLIITVREDLRGKLDALHDTIPDLWRDPIQVLPFGVEQARKVISFPLENPDLQLEHRVFFTDDVIESRLLPDLAARNPEWPNHILPADLQIVCDRLYQAAVDNQTSRINQALYDETSQKKGAGGIIAAFLEKTLHDQMPGQQSIALQVLEGMLVTNASFWISPGQIPTKESSSDQIQETMQRMVLSELLILRYFEGQAQYAFSSHSIAQAALELTAAQEVQQKAYKVRAELERIWSGWLARAAIPGEEELTFLEDSALPPDTPPEELLLLLSAAVAHRRQTTYWLDIFKPTINRKGDEEHQDISQASILVQRLEEKLPAGPEPYTRQTVLNQASLIFGLDDPGLPSPPSEFPYGPLAWSAAHHPLPSQRESASLALAVAYQDLAVKRVLKAIAAREMGTSIRQQRARRVELLAWMSDANPSIEQQNLQLPLVERLGVWLKRFDRRVYLDRYRIVSHSLGGALGAGLALGLLRIVTAALTGQLIGVEFALALFFGSLLGGAIALGVSLAPCTQFTMSGLPTTPLHSSVRLGTIFFGVMHILVAWLNGLDAAASPLVPVLGFPAGLGISLAVHDQPRAGWKLGLRRWLLRLGLAALTFMAAQFVFEIEKDFGKSLSVTWSSGLYHARLLDFMRTWMAEVHQAFPQWSKVFALFDAAAVGAVLAAGMIAGMVLADRWLTIGPKNRR